MESDRPLPGNGAGEHAISDVRVRHVRGPGPDSGGASWTGPDAASLSVAKLDDGVLLRFGPLATFSVGAAGAEIVCHETDAGAGISRHLLLDHVLPRVVNYRGGEALHASAVATPAGVVAFAGPSGAGKSTLAASFVRDGWPLVADDCVVVSEGPEGIVAVPAYDELRLAADAIPAQLGDDRAHPAVGNGTGKRRVAVGDVGCRFRAEPGPLAAIYCLGEATDAGVSIEPLPGRAQTLALTTSAFRLDVTDAAMLARQLRFLARVVALVPVRRLRFARGLDMLDAVRQAVLDDAGGAP